MSVEIRINFVSNPVKRHSYENTPPQKRLNVRNISGKNNDKYLSSNGKVENCRPLVNDRNTQTIICKTFTPQQNKIGEAIAFLRMGENRKGRG